MYTRALESFKEHAAATYPDECCGLLVSVNGREQYWKCTNTANNAADHFRISAEDYADAEDAGQVLAVCHSHPDASPQPSDADRVKCEASGLPWHIISVGMIDGQPEFGDMSYLEPTGYEAPLVGRQFAHGILDCYTLVQDWYWREKGIRLSNYERQDDWWEKGEELYSMERLNAEGFHRVNGDLQEGDMILMQVRSKVPNHAGVYLGDGQMLHHLHGRLSKRDPYGGYWAESTAYIVRHKELGGG